MPSRPEPPRREQVTSPAPSSCPTCGSDLPPGSKVSSHSLDALDQDRLRVTLASALCALILFFPGVILPIAVWEQFGFVEAYGVVTGALKLVAQGEVWIGIAILLFSVALPLTKISGLILLCAGLHQHRVHRGWVWGIVEHTGRWGMMDVLLVAVIIAWVKMADVVSVKAGPGLYAFAICVLLNLIASAAFPKSLLHEHHAR